MTERRRVEQEDGRQMSVLGRGMKGADTEKDIGQHRRLLPKSRTASVGTKRWRKEVQTTERLRPRQSSSCWLVPSPVARLDTERTFEPTASESNVRGKTVCAEVFTEIMLMWE